MRLRLGVEWLVVAISAAVLAALVLLTQAPPGEQLDTYSSADYRDGGYAAWAELLRREGIATAAYDRRLTELDRDVDTLIVAYPPASPAVPGRTLAEDAALAAWIRSGGRALILGSSAPLAAFERRQLGRPPDRAVAFASTTTVRAGAGEVTYVSDPAIFANRALARDGNARLAYLLARPRRGGGVVAFDEGLHGAIVDRAWWNVLGAGDRIALAGVALALALGLIGGALRMGPAVGLEPPREPTSAEYVDALAALYARAHLRAHALAGLRAALPAAVREGAAAKPLTDAARAVDLDDAGLIAGARLAYTLREERYHDRVRDRRRPTHPFGTRSRRRRE